MHLRSMGPMVASSVGAPPTLTQDHAADPIVPANNGLQPPPPPPAPPLATMRSGSSSGQEPEGASAPGRAYTEESIRWSPDRYQVAGHRAPCWRFIHETTGTSIGHSSSRREEESTAELRGILDRLNAHVVPAAASAAPGAVPAAATATAAAATAAPDAARAADVIRPGATAEQEGARRRAAEISDDDDEVVGFLLDLGDTIFLNADLASPAAIFDASAAAAADPDAPGAAAIAKGAAEAAAALAAADATRRQREAPLLVARPPEAIEPPPGQADVNIEGLEFFLSNDDFGGYVPGDEAATETFLKFANFLDERASSSRDIFEGVFTGDVGSPAPAVGKEIYGLQDGQTSMPAQMVRGDPREPALGLATPAELAARDEATHVNAHRLEAACTHMLEGTEWAGVPDDKHDWSERGISQFNQQAATDDGASRYRPSLAGLIVTALR